MNVRTSVALLVGVILVATVAAPIRAAPILIENGNAWARIWPDIADPDQGMDIWTVNGPDGVDWNILHQQWFWYSVDTVGGPMAEKPLEALDPAPFVFASDTDGDSLADNAFLRYTSASEGLEISVNYRLMGGTPASGVADIAETIRIVNTAAVAQTIHFFQFSDFNLSAADDTVEVTLPNTADEWFGALRLTETVVTPAATAYQVGVAADLLGLLNDGLPTTLDGTAGPVTGAVGWAFQWDAVLGPNATLLISKDKSVVLLPEPATLTFVGLGAALMAVRRRRTH